MGQTGAPGKAGVLVRPDSLAQPKHGIGGIESVVRVAGGRVDQTQTLVLSPRRVSGWYSW